MSLLTISAVNYCIYPVVIRILPSQGYCLNSSIDSSGNPSDPAFVPINQCNAAGAQARIKRVASRIKALDGKGLVLCCASLQRGERGILCCILIPWLLSFVCSSKLEGLPTSCSHKRFWLLLVAREVGRVLHLLSRTFDALYLQWSTSLFSAPIFVLE
jgi:hypothetical protein